MAPTSSLWLTHESPFPPNSTKKHMSEIFLTTSSLGPWFPLDNCVMMIVLRYSPSTTWILRKMEKFSLEANAIPPTAYSIFLLHPSPDSYHLSKLHQLENFNITLPTEPSVMQRKKSNYQISSTGAPSALPHWLFSVPSNAATSHTVQC